MKGLRAIRYVGMRRRRFPVVSILSSNARVTPLLTAAKISGFV